MKHIAIPSQYSPVQALNDGVCGSLGVTGTSGIICHRIVEGGTGWCVWRRPRYPYAPLFKMNLKGIYST